MTGGKFLTMPITEAGTTLVGEVGWGVAIAGDS